MVKWQCPHCGKTMHSSWDSRDDEVVICIHCDGTFTNPYFMEGKMVVIDDPHLVSKEAKMSNYLAESEDALSLFIDIVDSKMGEQLARAPKHQHDSIRYTYQHYINKASALKDEWIKQCEDDRLYGF